MKERKKLYKAGKLWVTATLVAFAGIVVTTTSASADDNTVVATSQTSQVNSSEPAPSTSTATPADEASATQNTLLSRPARQLAMLLRILRVGKPLPVR
ncbi:MAG: KxYKxGKxW signal peptide domain-containing protein [Limosilactobacillus sp.]